MRELKIRNYDYFVSKLILFALDFWAKEHREIRNTLHERILEENFFGQNADLLVDPI